MFKEYLQGVNVCVCACYLEAVLDVVARLPDAHSLQHTCVTQLPQHQVIIKPQGQLRKRKPEEKNKIIEEEGRTTEEGEATGGYREKRGK